MNTAIISHVVCYGVTQHPSRW